MLGQIKTDNVAVEAQPNYGAVFYCDGGAKPNPGNIGCGIHGYLYTDTRPKKGTGNSDVVLLMDGYFTKSEYGEVSSSRGFVDLDPSIPDWIVAYDKKRGADHAAFAIVTPVEYFDGYSAPIPGDYSNNVAELMAATAALTKAAEYNLKLVVIRTDSDYVVENATRSLYKWSRNNWTRDDGQPVKNIPMWKQLLAALEVLVQKNVKVIFRWIRGHDEHLGNV